jgi:lysophospholipase L1-like esterase
VRKVALSLVPLICLVAVAEVWFRLHPHVDEYETNTGLVEPDPDLIWRLRRVSAGPLATNELGLRDTPYRRDADVKILLLGDSVSWGNGIDDVRRVYPYLLERELEQRDPVRSYEVVNASVPGYSTFQELGYLERHGLALQPDAVIVQFCLNDVGERYAALAEYGGNNFFLGVDTRTTVRGIYGVLLRHSSAFEAAARAAQRMARRHERYRAVSLSAERLSPGLERAWERTLEEIDAIRGLASRKGIPILLLIAPFRFQVEDPARLRKPQDRLVAFARSRSLPYVDVLEAMSALGREAALPLFNDDSHFSEAGHLMVAQGLADPVHRLVATAQEPELP